MQPHNILGRTGTFQSNSVASYSRQAAQLTATATKQLSFFLLSMTGMHTLRLINSILVFARFTTLFCLLSSVFDMSKRKVISGGYQDSSDNEEGLDTGLGRPKPTPYAPPRLTTASRPGKGSFQFPGSPATLPRASAPPSRHVSVSSSSNCPTPVPESVQSARNTPEIQIGKAKLIFF